MDDAARVAAFIRWYEDAVAERRTDWRFGTVLHDDSFPNKYDANFLRVEEPVGEATAAELIAIADRVQAAHRHREFVFPDDGEGERLAGAFVEAGFESARFVRMVHRREPDRPAPAVRAEEVEHPAIRDLSVRASLEETPTMSREDAEMLADYRTVARDRVGARFFAAWDGGDLAGSCELYEHDGVAQVENVETLAAHRNKGVARAFLAAAMDAARAGGADMIFLVADDADWPKDLYGKLGFDPVGYHRQFTRSPSPT
jgi:GNAT superfamily N-acetyltransferase